jgi:Ankyrin repeats (3 copies)
VTPVSALKEEYQRYTSEYLLELRALGDGLTEDAHRVIEEIFSDRSEALPERGATAAQTPQTPPAPQKSVLPDELDSQTVESGPVLPYLIYSAVIVVALTLAKTFGYVWLVPILGIYLLAQGAFWWRKISKGRLTELMVRAADGDLARVQWLITHGVNVDARSAVGGTALMYAARNNRFEVVDYLLSVGADPLARSANGSSALDIARRGGYTKIAALLEQTTRV